MSQKLLSKAPKAQPEAKATVSVPVRPQGYFADALSKKEIAEDNHIAKLMLQKKLKH